MEQAVLHVADLAKKLGRTEAAIRAGVNRGCDWLPPRLKGHRLAWRTETVDQWLRDQEMTPTKQGA